MELLNTEWLDIKWFRWETLERFEWQYPLWLYGLAAIPLVYLLRWLFHYKTLQKLDIALLPNQVKSSPEAILRFVPPIFMSLALAFILVALARPQITDEHVERWTEGIDIMLILDISESMQIEDFSPNRLEAAKRVARNFIKGRFQDRIGIVIFSGEAISYAPLTTDYDLLYALIDEINFNMVQKSGTAIGSALAVGIARMLESKSKSKVMILLSDGENNAGSVDPQTAAKIAYAENIKVYTIGVGKEGRVPFGTDMFGRPRYVENSLDETTLRAIAEMTGGLFYRATNNSALQEIFATIDKFEKSEIKETRFKDTKDYYFIYLMWACVCWLIWLFLKSTFMSNILED
ncbi:MAG: VWA domain-containing protein [Cytophagales bacterium]|nr:VWA domain-containing protein [Cytophagales bacterium]MDW8384098.1 VWA domain-containing protein [Flammeovirgaceae bacterium]